MRYLNIPYLCVMSVILAIESSCDETSAALCVNGKILANITATQAIHTQYGGVIPEIASRIHQQNIIPVVHTALQTANIHKNDVQAVAFTRGPGLLGALLVGVSFAKGFAQAQNIPLVEVNHIQAHILSHFIDNQPNFPFLCLTVSGGHTQITLVKDYFDMELLGSTQDDAAGEAFDKTAKILGLPYPGGPLIDKYAKEGKAIFPFPEPNIPGFGFSFSGLKTAILYFVQNKQKENPDFLKDNLADICASVQDRIVSILINKLLKAAEHTGVKELAIAGGVSANSGLRSALLALESKGYKIHIPKFEYCTDNAAMIAITGYHKHRLGIYSPLNVSAEPRLGF